MTQVLLFTSPHFRGTITDTPSGTAYHVKPGQTIAADDKDVPLLQTFGFTPAAPSAMAGSALTLSDGSGHTITNTGSIVLGTGGTLSGSGGVGTIGGFGGSGGGALAGGLGIDLDTITNPGTTVINNTGTLIQPAATGATSGLGITISSGAASGEDGSRPGNSYLLTGSVSQAGTAAVARGAVLGVRVGDVTLTNTLGAAQGGNFYAYGGAALQPDGSTGGGPPIFYMGAAYSNPAISSGGHFQQSAGGALSNSTINQGGSFDLLAGSGSDGVTAFGGGITLTSGAALGGSETNVAGSIVLNLGYADNSGSSINTNGMLVINNLGTDDPLVLDAVFRKPDTGLLTQSNGGGVTGYQNGLGITIINGSISNTGTIVQPDSTGSDNGVGVKLQTGRPGPTGNRAGLMEIYTPAFTYAGTNHAYGGGIVIYAYKIQGSDPAANLSGGGIQLFGGGAQVSGGAYGKPGNFYLNPGIAQGSTYARGVDIGFNAGGAAGATSSQIGGSLYFNAGGVDEAGTNRGGNIHLQPATGPVNGNLIIANVPTVDPHIFGALWTLDTLTGAVAISQG